MVMVAAEGEMSLSNDAFCGVKYAKLFILKRQNLPKGIRRGEAAEREGAPP